MESTDVTKSLRKKGFEPTGRQDEEEYTYPGTFIRTHVSRGGKHTLSPQLIKMMAIQIHLKKSEFEQFVSCTFTKEKYKDHLISLNKLPLDD